jgi:uncharacterized membrane protein YphA (DoxX/SURF4 family)
MDLGLLILRVVVGLTLAAHGSQKLFGWFGGHGLAGTGSFLEQLGFRPGKMQVFLRAPERAAARRGRPSRRRVRAIVSACSSRS